MWPTLTVAFAGPTTPSLASAATESYLLPVVDDQGGTEYRAGIRGYDLGLSMLYGDAFMMSKMLVFGHQHGQVGSAQAPRSGRPPRG